MPFPLFNLPNCRNFLDTSIEKTIQGMSEASEKTSPIVPAVEGIIINNPEDNPIAAFFLL
ncbi:hypothetical protein [Desulfosporosinus orientis]|uniref:hypothetical protein n=1 Tax=Desulfosporosinus orientis TaxID=1563 RepID=UPI0002F721AF|nr:hypothetical protein [Desulfosporosinus orientis]